MPRKPLHTGTAQVPGVLNTVGGWVFWVSWENIWGTWNGITPRDGEALKRIGLLLRFFSVKKSFLTSKNWFPYTIGNVLIFFALFSITILSFIFI